MKKYLMTGVAALAFAATFTSCSKAGDLYDEGAAKEAETQKQTEQILASYNQAFLKTFGQPAADQDWGFGTVASTRSIIAEINDPFTKYTNTDALYKTEVPSTAKTIDDFKRADWGGALDENALQNCTEFSFANGTFAMHCWQNSRDIYVSGNVIMNVDNTNSLNQARIYVLPNANLTFNMSSYINNLEIYVAARATLNYNAEQLYYQDGGGIIFNRGTLNLQENFEANQKSIVYNEGTINGTDITSKPGDGNPSYFYNYGDLLLSGDLELNSCANFYNEGTVDVDGETSVTQQKIWWINKGHYTTGSIKFSAKNTTFYNYCNLIVEGNAHMYDGEFNLMDNSYIEAETAEFDNFIVNMGNNSGFNVKGNNKWEAQGDGTYQGFKATGDKAYVRLGGTTTVAGHLHSLELTGKITYAINNIKDLGEGNSGVQPTTVFNRGTKKVTDFSKLNATAKTNDCGADWDGEPETYDVCIIAEDLSATDATDYDFNDVVFEVKYTSATTATIQLKAAGGTLPLTVAGKEVHAEFGYPNPDPETGKYKMINTGAKANVNGATADPFDVTGIDRSKRGKDIIIKVNKGTAENPHWIEMQANAGEPAAKLAVESGFEWCDERQPIAEKYPKFPGYVQDKKVVWY
jgi:hypothetical protein